MNRKILSSIGSGLVAGAAVLGLGVAAVLGPAVNAEPAGPDAVDGVTRGVIDGVGDQRPNIVLILMDDFSTELLATMPQAQRLRAEGASYENAFVVDSLCCPSRAALLTGQAPHQTGVRTNLPGLRGRPLGGYRAFEHYGNADRTFNVALQESGYHTGFIGKFMNGYEAKKVDGVLTPPPAVPGWSDFQAILGGGYNGWEFRSTRTLPDGTLGLQHHPAPPRESPNDVIDRSYATNVAADKALGYIAEHEGGAQPYFLEIATYGPHGQLRAAYPDNPVFPPAMADRPSKTNPQGNCGLAECWSLTTDDLLGYDDPREDNAPSYLGADGTTSAAPAWRTNDISLGQQKAQRQYRDRARMVQSIDRLIGRVRAAVGEDTYVVLTADNGFHLGQHQLNGGKGTPYDSDTRVPLVVSGPDVVPGEREQFVNNIDLAPTFEQLAGLRPASFRSGTGFAESLDRPDAEGGDGGGDGGGRYAFFEHTFAYGQPGPEPDDDPGSYGVLDIIPSYVAVRGEEGLLARFDLDESVQGKDYAWELYRYDRPWEDVNVFAEDHDEPYARELRRRLEAWDGCAPRECRALTR